MAFQISEHLQALGSTIGVRCAVIVGGVDMVDQAIALSKKPHIIVCTPGRLVDHLENTKGFHMKTLKYLVSSTANFVLNTLFLSPMHIQVMDEADRLLSMDFGKELEVILKVIPKERRTMLFSATVGHGNPGFWITSISR